MSSHPAMPDAEVAERLGLRIREIRERRKLTQALVSARSGIARANIARLENAREHVPSTMTVLRIAAALEVEPTEVFEVLDTRQRLHK